MLEIIQQVQIPEESGYIQEVASKVAGQCIWWYHIVMRVW